MYSHCDKRVLQSDVCNTLHLLLRGGGGGELVECCFTSRETVGLLGTGAHDGHLDFHTAPELCPYII